jgi:hypothetical protein
VISFRPWRLLQAHEGGVGHHLAFLVLDVEIVEIRRHAPELRLRLHVDLVELPEADEALLVGAADEDRQVVQRLADGDALLHGHLVVDLQLVLRIVVAEEGEQAAQFRALAQCGHEALVDLAEAVVVAGVGLVEQAQREAAGGAVAGIAGGPKNSMVTPAISRVFSSSSSMISSTAVLALGPVLEVDQAGAGVGAAPLGEHLVARQCRSPTGCPRSPRR